MYNLLWLVSKFLLVPILNTTTNDQTKIAITLALPFEQELGQENVHDSPSLTMARTAFSRIQTGVP